MGRVMEPFDPNERLLEKILSKENMADAWKRVKANQGAPGVDGISVNRLVRTRMPGGVGAGGEKPPATRLNAFISFVEKSVNLKY